MDAEKQKLLDEFVERMRTIGGTNLLAVILYGSAAAGDYVPEHSDVNLLCVLNDTSYAAIEILAPVVEWWGALKHRAPLLMSAEEVRRSADVFSIEFLDMRRNHLLLWGEDILKTLEIPMRLHRAQLEYELREKTILLRQRLLLSRSEQAKWELLLHSLPAFATLFRHVLIALGDSGRGSKREVAAALTAKLGIDASVFGELLDMREGKPEAKREGKPESKPERNKDRSKAKVDEIFARYLRLVEEVTATVDKMLDPAA
jgi:predicted nucleotidyltransferase